MRIRLKAERLANLPIAQVPAAGPRAVQVVVRWKMVNTYIETVTVQHKILFLRV